MLHTFKNGIPIIMLDNVPTFRRISPKKLQKYEQIILLEKNNKKKTFAVIANELKLTQEKVNAIYQSYYHKKIMAAIEIINPLVDFDFHEYIFSCSHYANKRWEIIQKDYKNLITKI